MATQLIVSVVEDHELLREATVSLLQENGFHAVGWDSAEAVYGAPMSALPNVYIVDVGLPGASGLELARHLRTTRPSAGIVIVTARSNIPDRVEGYRSGADVYLIKPVEPDELLAVVRSQQARLCPVHANDAWWLEPATCTITHRDAKVQLTPPEAGLLAGLAQAPDNILSREETAQQFNLTLEDRHKASMNVRLSQLRRKLRSVGAPEPSIKSLRDRGLRLCFQLSLM